MQAFAGLGRRFELVGGFLGLDLPALELPDAVSGGHPLAPGGSVVVRVDPAVADGLVPVQAELMASGALRGSLRFQQLVHERREGGLEGHDLGGGRLERGGHQVSTSADGAGQRRSAGTPGALRLVLMAFAASPPA